MRVIVIEKLFYGPTPWGESAGADGPVYFISTNSALKKASAPRAAQWLRLSNNAYPQHKLAWTKTPTITITRGDLAQYPATRPMLTTGISKSVIAAKMVMELTRQ